MELEAIVEPEVEVTMEPEAVVEPEVEVAVEPVNPLLRILPTEMWGLILDKIEDPKDRVNAANSDTLFREYFRSEINEESWTLTLLGMVLPELYDYLPGRDLLTLRQVSKGCRNTIDNLLESGDMWKLVDYESVNEHGKIQVNLTKYYPLQLQKRVQYNQFVNQLRALPEAKLIGRTVRVEDSDDYNSERFFDFFQEFGTLVHHLQVILHPIPMRTVVRYIQNFLRNTPNLKTLTLEFTCCFHHGTEPEDVVRFFNQNPLPDLPNLVSLTIFAQNHYVGGSDQFLGEMLVKYGAQLENLKLSKGLIPLPSPMPLLTHLSLGIGNFSDYWAQGVRNPANMETFQSLRILEASLQKLKLEFHIDVNLVELFRILETYKDSLKQLSLWFPCSTSKDAYHRVTPAFPTWINLPELEELELIGYRLNGNTSFDFLASFPKLKRLKLEADRYHWICTYGEDNEEPAKEYNADSDKHGFAKNLIKDSMGLDLEVDYKVMLYMSPIWKALPLLESLVFWETRLSDSIRLSCSRRHYEYYQDKLAMMSFY